VVFEHFKEHLGKAKGGIGRKAPGIREMANGIEGAEDIRGAIDQKKSGAIRHKRLFPSPFPSPLGGEGWGEGGILTLEFGNYLDFGISHLGKTCLISSATGEGFK
jgi:hypothetical protein